MCIRDSVDGAHPDEAAVAAMLAPLARVNAEDRELAALKADAQRLLLNDYAGLDTDWDQVGRHEEWAGRFAEAVTLMAGDPAAAIALRTHLQPLVAENRAFLSPGATLGKRLLETRDAWRALRDRLAAVDAQALSLIHI